MNWKSAPLTIGHALCGFCWLISLAIAIKGAENAELWMVVFAAAGLVFIPRDSDG